MNNMAAMHRARMPQTNSVCRIQKKGRWSSSRSRSVPPPNAATKATTHTPTASSRLRAAMITPESANATVAATSSVSRSVWIQGASMGKVMGAIVPWCSDSARGWQHAD